MEFARAAQTTVVCEVMCDSSRTGVWRLGWNGTEDWEGPVRIADLSGHEYMWSPHVRALAVGLRRRIVRIPTRTGTSGEPVEIIRVFLPDPDHPK